MKENSFDSGTPAFDVVLAQTIARHFRGATTETIDDAQTVRLGEGLPTIECFIDEIQDHEPYGAFLFLQISGGAFGSRPVLVTASGYGSSQLASVVTAGCNWACAFGPVLLTGIGRPDLIDSDNPDVEQFEATVGGRRYRVATGHLDRSMSMPIEEVEAYRRRLGGPRALTDRVLASPLIPATRSDEAVALGCYAAIGPHSITELKLAGADWPAGRSVLDALPPEPGGHRMLREWSVLTPLEPAPPLTRDGLQHTLNLIAATSHDPGSEAGWLGSRHHGMRLGPPSLPAGLSLPEDLRWFLSTIAGSGAGPGYGLDIYPADDGGIHLADAGCGAEWRMSPYDGNVWLDSRACDDGFTRVAPSFISWYEAWLDHAIRGGGCFAQWSYQVDAAYKMLEQSAARVRRRAPPRDCHPGEDPDPDQGLRPLPRLPARLLPVRGAGVGLRHGPLPGSLSCPSPAGPQAQCVVDEDGSGLPAAEGTRRDPVRDRTGASVEAGPAGPPYFPPRC